MVTINKAIVGGESDSDVWQGCELDLSMVINSRLPRYTIEVMRELSERAGNGNRINSK